NGSPRRKERMQGNKRSILASLGLMAAMLAGVYLWAAEKPTTKERREGANKAFKDGNYKVAYEALRQLVLDKDNEATPVGEDLNQAISALQHLGRSDEIDELRESAVTVHSGNWRLLHRAAMSLGRVEPYGYMVAGKFQRGYKRGGGKYVSTGHRDRVRAL